MNTYMNINNYINTNKIVINFVFIFLFYCTMFLTDMHVCYLCMCVCVCVCVCVCACVCVCVCACVYVSVCVYTLTGHFIRYTLLVPGWASFCLQNWLNSSWHRFNKVLETFLRDLAPYCHDSITQLLQICRLHIHDENLPFHHIPKVLYWIEIWWMWRPFE